MIKIQVSLFDGWVAFSAHRVTHTIAAAFTEEFFCVRMQWTPVVSDLHCRARMMSWTAGQNTRLSSLRDCQWHELIIIWCTNNKLSWQHSVVTGGDRYPNKEIACISDKYSKVCFKDNWEEEAEFLRESKHKTLQTVNEDVRTVNRHTSHPYPEQYYGKAVAKYRPEISKCFSSVSK